MPWFRATTTPDKGNMVDVQSLFWVAFREVAARHREVPSEMAMFATKDFGVSQAYFYFTPATECMAPEFLKAVHAEPCSRPFNPVSFQVGDDSARRLFESGGL